jgi:hypothetical protein
MRGTAVFCHLLFTAAYIGPAPDGALRLRSRGVPYLGARRARMASRDTDVRECEYRYNQRDELGKDKG